MIIKDFDDLLFCKTCQFHDADNYCRVYDKNCNDVKECFQYIENES